MQKNSTALEKILAWSVHVFTASGLIPAFLAILSIDRGDWRLAMIWLVVALVIDGLDGTLARWFRVEEILPQMNGKLIDFVIDFATYVIIPVYFFYKADLVQAPWALVCAVFMLLSSALYYGKAGMVSEDKYFVGFPALWNMTVFYLFFVYDLSDLFTIILIAFLAVLHFVPIKFAYPSQQQRFQGVSLAVSAVFIVVLGLFLYWYPARPAWLVAVATVVVIYFGAIAVWETLRS